MKVTLQIRRPFDVAIRRTEQSAVKLLKMCGLGMNEKLIDRFDLNVVDQAQADSHAYLRKVVHRFFAANFLGCA